MSEITLLDFAIELHQDGKLAEAERAYRQILAVNPNNADALQLLGVIANQAGQPAAAVELIEKALALKPNHVDAHCNLGTALLELDDADGAAAAFNGALALNPKVPEALNNLANIHRKQGRLEEAEEHYRRAIACQPRLAEAHSNLGIVLHELGRFADAEDSYRRVLGIDPNHAEAHANLATTLLMQGKLAEGWTEHEWRWRKKSFTAPRRDFTQPQWDGAPLDGKTLLLHAEQGFGDTIAFIRYAPLAKAKGGRTVVECPAQLRRLVVGMDGVDDVVAAGETPPPFDVHAPLLSLPLIFQTTLQTIPAETGYLKADNSLSEEWRRRLSELAGLKVGLAWQGNKAQGKDRTRSTPLALLEPLLEVPSVSFVSLQKGDGEEQVAESAFSGRMTEPTADIADFADTAALIDTLDIVISVDTAVAHLAGALGKPAWLLLEYVPYWLYMAEGAQSPWYPTARLLRQNAHGDWQGVVAQAKKALQDLVNDS